MGVLLATITTLLFELFKISRRTAAVLAGTGIVKL